MNENNVYRVLWIDDEHEALSPFIDLASQEGFKVTSFSTSQDGMEFLQRYLADVEKLPKFPGPDRTGGA